MVTVYSTPTCAYCHMAKQYLAGRKVAFTEKDISSDTEAFNFVVNTIGQAATPVIDIDGDVIVGFDRERIDVSLRDKKLI